MSNFASIRVDELLPGDMVDIEPQVRGIIDMTDWEDWCWVQDDLAIVQSIERHYGRLFRLVFENAHDKEPVILNGSEKVTVYTPRQGRATT